MKRKNNKWLKIKSNTGITLIALAITIIVLLILAGVTIAALSGDNGILTRAKDAKEKTEQAQQNEEKTLSNMENVLGIYNFKNIDKADSNPAEVVPENSTVLDDDANNGIVIKDQNNNEWVWVEVPKTTVFSGLTIDTSKDLTEQNYNDIRDKLIEYASTYRGSYSDEWYAKDGDTLITASTSNLADAQKSLKNGCGLTYNEYKTTYQKMLKSVYTYGGFWIGRYEAGIEGSIDDVSKARTSHTDIEILTSPKAINQKNAIPYNWIYCSEAQVLAKEMTPNSNYISSLMFGIQWDLICKFLEVKSTLTISNINSDSTIWGNYRDTQIENIISGKYAIDDGLSLLKWTKISGSYTKLDLGDNYKTLLSTGISDYTKKMNIYDFAGNEWEWTLEHATSDSNSPCSSRGGDYYDYASITPASRRYGSNIFGYYSSFGFRTMLYKN